MYKKNEGLSTLQWIGFVAVLAGMMCFGSGCMLLNPNGFEMHAKLGARAIDTHEEKQTTVVSSKPAICYILPSRCAGQQAQQGQQPEGS